jgi:hypothetical protein
VPLALSKLVAKVARLEQRAQEVERQLAELERRARQFEARVDGRCKPQQPCRKASRIRFGPGKAAARANCRPSARA